MRLQEDNVMMHPNDRPVVYRENAATFEAVTANTATTSLTPSNAAGVVQIDVSGRPLTPRSSTVDKLPKLIEVTQQLLLTDSKCKYGGRRLPKPVWPKSAPTIPSTTLYKVRSSLSNELSTVLTNIIFQSVELHFNDIVRPAPVVRRPFEAIYSPYPMGCSKLCNHPIDKDLKREYKEVLRKTKENMVRYFVPIRISKNGLKKPYYS